MNWLRIAWTREPLLTAICGIEMGVGIVAIVWLCIIAPGLHTAQGNLPDPDKLIEMWEDAEEVEEEPDPMAWLDRDVPDLTCYEWAWFAFEDVEQIWFEWSRQDGEDVLHWTRLSWRAKDVGDAELYAFCQRQIWRCRRQWRFE